MTKVIGNYTAAATIDGSTHYLLIQPGSASTAYNKINRNVLLGVSGQPADISSSQNLTNKTLDNTNTITLKDTLFTLQDDGDTTKQAKFQLSGITTATTRTYTLPNASSTLADIATAQTLTNKTLTSPVITGGTIDNSTITVDAIAEHTAANGVTVDGLNIKDGKLNTNNSVVTANITDTAVTPAKLQTGTGSGWSWTSWTPSWTNVTVGNAVIETKYIQTGKTVNWRLSFAFGSSSSFSGIPTFSLPVTAVTYPNLSNIIDPIGTGSILDFGAGTPHFFAQVRIASTTTAQLWYLDTGANPQSASSTAPMTWTNGDKFSVFGQYEAA